MKLKNRKGQAAVEFIAVVVVVFFFLLFYLSLAILLVGSSYMDYATFMAARTYKSGFSSEEYQKIYAQQIFQKYVSQVDGFIRNPKLSFAATNAESEQGKGAFATYDIDLFYLPPLFLGGAIPNGRLKLKSESFLGRDPAYNDCYGYFQEVNRRFNLGLAGTDLLEMMEDNGC